MTDPRDFVYERTGCVFSPDRQHRYVLWRDIDLNLFSEDKVAMFIGLNPSTADEVKNDPTVRRCIGFARIWGCGKMCMTNIFAYRATDPRVMKRAADPVGPQNDDWLTSIAKGANIIVAAWGKHGLHKNRDTRVRELLKGKELMCFGINNDQTPKHPLYMSYRTRLRPLPR